MQKMMSKIAMAGAVSRKTMQYVSQKVSSTSDMRCPYIWAMIIASQLHMLRTQLVMHLMTAAASHASSPLVQLLPHQQAGQGPRVRSLTI